MISFVPLKHDVAMSITTTDNLLASYSGDGSWMNQWISYKTVLYSSWGAVYQLIFLLVRSMLCFWRSKAAIWLSTVKPPSNFICGGFFAYSICVSVTGVIGFVDWFIPHFIRLLRLDYRFLLIGSFLGGGIFLTLCDVVARTIISPNELPIGVITGIAGGVLFINCVESS